MAEENVQKLFDAARCFERGDWERLGSLIAADARMTPLDDWPEPGPFVGRAEIIREYERLLESFNASEIAIDELDLRDDWVLARYRWVMRGTSSGIPQTVSFWGALRFEAGLVVEVHYRWQKETVLASLRGER